MEQTHEDAPHATGSLTGSEEALIRPTTAGGTSNKRAFKIAGLTTLACLLLASQVFTAYLVFDQKGQIHNLQKNTDTMRRQLTHRAQVAPVQMQIPMNTMPLLTDFTEDGAEKAKILFAEPEDVAAVSVEKQLKDLLQNSQLPQFNETFLTNLESLKKQMEEAEWKGFESWMRNWLIFQMAQEMPPAPPTATVVQTECQVEAGRRRGKIGSYQPQCDEQGNFKTIQCWHSTGFCWCVDERGAPIEGTTVRGRPECHRASRRMMASPMMMQLKSFKKDE